MKQDSPLISSNQPVRNWPASLTLSFVQRGKRTVMDRMDFYGPLRVQRPFYPEGNEGPCHTYILHPPGGIVSGDTLCLQADCKQGTHVLLTTPSAGKIYKADQHRTGQTQTIHINVHNGICEWLPMETLVFDGANARIETRIELKGQARLIGWDILCLGRPENNLPFCNGSLIQGLHIAYDGIPLLHERLAVYGNDTDFRSETFGLSGHSALGTFFAVGPEAANPDCIQHLRATLPDLKNGLWAATCRRGILVVRYLGPRADEAASLFRQIWELIRPRFLDRQAVPPRIWST